MTRFLASALLDGPDRERLARLDRDALSTWYAHSAYTARQGNTLRTAIDDFLARYQQGFEVTWRSRAATALGVLGTEAARTALDSALKLKLHFTTIGHVTILKAVTRATKDSGRAAAENR